MSRCQTCSIDHRPRCPDTRVWPIAPLLAVLTDTQRLNIPRALGVSGGMLSEIEGGGLPDRTADRIAVRLGLHPALIWPGWVDAGLTVTDRQFVQTGWRQAWEHSERPIATEAAA